MANPWDDDEPVTTAGPWDEDAAVPQGSVNGARPRQGTPDVGTIEGVKQMGSTLDDFVRVLARGATFGGADHLAAKGAELTGLGGPADVAGQQAATAQAKEDLGPVAGGAAELAGGLASGALLPGAAVANAGRAIATGAAIGAGSTTAQSYFDTGDMPAPADLAVGTIVGAAGAGLGYGAGKIFQQPKIGTIAKKNADLLNKEGIDITAGQATGDLSMIKSEAKAPGAWEFMEKQKQAFSRAALKKAGIVADESGRVSQQALDDGFNHVGSQMNQLASNNNLRFKIDKNGRVPLLDDMRQTYTTYKGRIEGKAASTLKDTIKQVSDAVKQGEMTGAKWQEISSDLFKTFQSNKNSPLGQAALDMRRTLADAMEDSIKAFNPNDAGLWQMANRSYSNLLVVQKAVNSASADAAGGLVTPQALAAATKAGQGAGRYARGSADFSELAHAGASLLRNLPVGANASAQEMATILGRKVLAGTAGFMMGGPHGGAAGYALPGAIDSLAGKLRLTPFSSLPTNSAALGARAGVSLGTDINSANPFSRLNTQGL